MKVRYLVIISLIFSLFIACTHMSGRITIEEDMVEPPFTNLKSRFNTLEEWLTYICENDKPSKAIDTYNFGLFEGKDEYTLYLVGTNTYEISEDNTKIKIEFSPTDMYFSLPLSEFQGLKREQVYAQLSRQLKQFTKTNTYKSSFFLKANHVKTEWNGEML